MLIRLLAGCFQWSLKDIDVGGVILPEGINQHSEISLLGGRQRTIKVQLYILRRFKF